jgi:pSer/pThr/pTyr-binding forkhead associated (FHA) protein
MGPVAVEFEVDERLRTGRFGVDGRLRAAEGGATAHLLLPTGEQVVLGEYLLSMGRLPECTITLADPNVSRRHAEIRPHGDAWLLTDLRSTNGTLVNGTRITSHRLLDGDRIQIGNTVIEFRIG